jgi:endonuclease/exonuclease/phosphatase family metal-dependent hydrolase
MQKNTGNNIYEITYKNRKAAAYKISEAEIKHQQEADIIRKAMNQQSEPVMFCGDLNITPTSYNYRILKDDMQDAFLVKGSGIGNTFYKIAPTLRIDVCFADKAFQVKQCKREPKKLSDHYPLITDVGWKK